MRMAFAKITNRFTRFLTILATLVVGCAFVFASGANAAAGDKKVEIKKTENIVKIEKIEKTDNILKMKGVDSKAVANENGVVVNQVNFNPFFRPFDAFFIVNGLGQFDEN